MAALFIGLLFIPVYAVLLFLTSLLSGAVLMWLENLCQFWTHFGYWHNVWVTFATSLLILLVGLNNNRVNTDD